MRAGPTRWSAAASFTAAPPNRATAVQTEPDGGQAGDEREVGELEPGTPGPSTSSPRAMNLAISPPSGVGLQGKQPDDVSSLHSFVSSWREDHRGHKHQGWR